GDLLPSRLQREDAGLDLRPALGGRPGSALLDRELHLLPGGDIGDEPGQSAGNALAGDRGPLLVDDVVPRTALPLRVELAEDPAPIRLEGRHRDGDFLLRRRRRQPQGHHHRQTQPFHSLHPCVSVLSVWSQPFGPRYSRFSILYSSLKDSPARQRVSDTP